jgi:linoleoyl-CoA desaturase
MKDQQAVRVRTRAQPARTASPTRSISFDRGTAFQVALRQRVTEHFSNTGRRPRGGWQIYVKTVILLSGSAAAYALLVFVARTAAEGVPLAIFLGLFAAGIGMNIQHDAGHRAYSHSPRVNRLMALTLELIGGSAYLWRWKHGIFHHTHVNLTGHDTDIDLGILARLTPHQPRLAFHRWQHLYLWALYGLLVIKWQLVGDFQKLIAGRIRTRPFPRPKGWDLVSFVAGKVVFFTLAFAIPLRFHSIGVVLCYYGVAAVVAGSLLSVVFQVGHCVEEVAFPVPHGTTGRIGRPWAIHQVETTADFARGSRVAAWLSGGLNFQIEHHLFPQISHVHYPALSTIVEQTCREFGVRYMAFRSFQAALMSHFRWLQRMGMPPQPADPIEPDAEGVTPARVGHEEPGHLAPRRVHAPAGGRPAEWSADELRDASSAG